MISIHAPRVGRDAGVARVHDFTNDFNPRAPCGARRCFCKNIIPQNNNFNPRAPCGARQWILLSRRSKGYFNPRAPCGARREVSVILYRELRISIHAPRVGRDSLCNRSFASRYNFNPRAPCGARLQGLRKRFNAGNFNPRAPCGARRNGFCDRPRRYHFNPRAPCGARRWYQPQAVSHFEFQSTRPVWGATF